MTRKRLFVALFLFFMILSASACGCLGGGSGSQQTVETKTTTLGQELTDLQKAHESGAITDEQYQKAKKELLKKYNAE
jgi:hypothetical protein